MNKDLKELLDSGSISKADIAVSLFPRHQHPTAALEGVIKGTRELRVSEAQVLEDLNKAKHVWHAFNTGEDTVFICGNVRVLAHANGYILTKGNGEELRFTLPENLKISDALRHFEHYF